MMIMEMKLKLKFLKMKMKIIMIMECEISQNLPENLLEQVKGIFSSRSLSLALIRFLV